MNSQHYEALVDAVLGNTQYTRKRREGSISRPTCQHGVNDSEYPNTIATSQISKSVNFDMTAAGELETRGGSQLLTDTAAASTGEFPHEHQFVVRASDGTLTRTRMLKSGTVLYKYNTSTGVFDSVRTSLSTARPSMVNFVSSTGADIMLYADGSNFLMYDGTSFTDILSNFTAGNATSAPTCLLVKHNVVFAAGVKEDPDVLFWCDPNSPNTDWPTQGFAIIAGGVDKISGIGEIYDYVVVTALNSIHLLTGRTSATFAFFQVNGNNGCSSHWSIISQGGYIYFANASGFHIGRLRIAESDGMEVDYIGGNMQITYNNITAGFWDNIVGAYHDDKKQIYWTVKTAGATQPDRLFVYSAVQSSPASPPSQFGPDIRYVWAGYYEGLDFNSVIVHQDADGKDFLSVANASGQVYTMHTGFKDKRAVGVDTGTNIAYEIRPREETFGRVGDTVRVVAFFPTMYQKHNSGFSVQFLVNRSVLYPASAVTITFSGNIPYWHDGTDARITSEWDGTVWADKSVLSAKIGLKKKCYSIIPIITSDGSNAQEEGTWIGYGMTYQRMPQSQGRAV